MAERTSRSRPPANAAREAAEALLRGVRARLREGSLDWRPWVDRWDRMQRHYLVRRDERIETLVRLVRTSQRPDARILDLGCGTGSLMHAFLEALPECRVVGVDFDPTLLPLAEARLAPFAGRWQVVLADLRGPSWPEAVGGPVDAVVSATALHWLRPDALARLYRQLAGMLRPGGILLNADHVASAHPPVQDAWERHRTEMRQQEDAGDAEDWASFWTAYTAALGLDAPEVHQRVLGGWEGGIEQGMPLAWHIDQLRAAGFTAVDCFWRCDADAIYGGIREGESSDED